MCHPTIQRLARSRSVLVNQCNHDAQLTSASPPLCQYSSAVSSLGKWRCRSQRPTLYLLPLLSIAFFLSVPDTRTLRYRHLLDTHVWMLSCCLNGRCPRLLRSLRLLILNPHVFSDLFAGAALPPHERTRVKTNRSKHIHRHLERTRDDCAHGSVHRGT